MGFCSIYSECIYFDRMDYLRDCKMGRQVMIKVQAFCSNNAGDIIEMLPMVSVWFERPGNRQRFGFEIIWIRFTAGIHFWLDKEGKQ